MKFNSSSIKFVEKKLLAQNLFLQENIPVTA